MTTTADIKDNLKYTWNYEEAIASAKERGFQVFQSNSTLLLLDLDDDSAQGQFAEMYPILKAHYNLLQVNQWTSKSGRGLHVLVMCAAMEFKDRLLLQMSLGSDLKRETLALLMHESGIKEPSWLFKPPAA